jgi:hypothetical protein
VTERAKAFSARFARRTFPDTDFSPHLIHRRRRHRRLQSRDRDRTDNAPRRNTDHAADHGTDDGADLVVAM